MVTLAHSIRGIEAYGCRELRVHLVNRRWVAEVKRGSWESIAGYGDTLTGSIEDLEMKLRLEPTAKPPRRRS